MNNAAPGWTPASVQTPARQNSGNDGQIDLGELFGLLWAQKWMILLVTLVTMLLGLLYVQTASELYEAKATLILEEQSQSVTGLEELVGGISSDDLELNSQIEIIRSRKIVGTVVDSQNLATDEEFVSDLAEPGVLDTVIGTVRKYTIGLLSGSEKSAKPQQSHRETAIDALIEKLQLSVLPKTYVFQIRLETTSPQKSVDIVNALATAFVSDQVTARVAQTSEASVWLADKVAALGEDLAAAEAAAANYRSTTERAVTEADVASSNVSLKNARGRRDSFITNLVAATGSDLPRTDRDIQRLEALQDDITSLESIVAKQTQDLLTLRQLDREAEAAATIYAHFVTRLNEIEVQKGLQESDVRSLSEAIPRYTPTKPRKVLTMAIATLIGLLLGAAYVVLQRLLDRSFNDPAELQLKFGIPVVGTIPRAPERGRRDLLTYAVKRPESAIMESIRDLRTSLTMSGRDAVDGTHNATVLVMTSSVAGEGKTTSSILLAVNSAKLKKRVLLIECDLRRSTFQSYFGRPTTLGLVDAIDAEEGWEASIWTETNTNADIIFGGRSKGRNAADIFASSEFADFINRMRSEYDLIILDSPPVLAVPDARLIAKISDVVLYVVRSASTPASTVAAGLRLFENVGIRVDGLNLTQMKKGAGYGYGYGAYSQNSKYYQN